MAEKPLFWVGSSLEDLRAFPEGARRAAGHQLHLIQHGLEPHDSRPMPSVGPGVYEIRIHIRVEHRVFYVAKYPEAVYILHGFEKETRRTERRDIDLAKHRLAQVMKHRENIRGRNRKGEPS